ncbi:receptor-interacting serine/threonine-protein kinase 4 [Quercus suber]|uniref:Receptor-interacting serine/threonine-protein kinase 4 n=1 Tax=Quercus suber TaxID=58331 RepID=A0AAW0INS2_QUESU|nr:receptor-interacting serine/threonine-protein kinase 4 [Quercus suber]
MECSLLLETSPKLNTILHVAASSGHDELVKVILQTKGCQEHVRKKNSTDNLALHVAASVGHLPIVKLLLSYYQQLEEPRYFGQLREQNKEGNTPLHVALINKYQNVDLKMKRKYHEVASFLVEMDPEVSYFQVNEASKSPLYMVAEAQEMSNF